MGATANDVFDGLIRALGRAHWSGKNVRLGQPSRSLRTVLVKLHYTVLQMAEAGDVEDIIRLCVRDDGEIELRSEYAIDYFARLFTISEAVSYCKAVLSAPTKIFIEPSLLGDGDV